MANEKDVREAADLLERMWACDCETVACEHSVGLLLQHTRELKDAIIRLYAAACPGWAGDYGNVDSLVANIERRVGALERIAGKDFWSASRAEHKDNDKE